jgi:N4-(beta-N-acetylglucosaminyl)-L-asparaginase
LLPGRVGDSPIAGAGCYTDQHIGSAGATGSGEENIKVAGVHTMAENMRLGTLGMSPRDPALEALLGIARHYNNMSKLRFVDLTYLRKDGAHAGASLWDGASPPFPQIPEDP